MDIINANKPTEKQQYVTTTYIEIDFRNVASYREMFQIIDEKRRNDDVCNLPYGIIEKVPNPMNTLAEVRFQ